MTLPQLIPRTSPALNQNNRSIPYPPTLNCYSAYYGMSPATFPGPPMESTSTPGAGPSRQRTASDGGSAHASGTPAEPKVKTTAACSACRQRKIKCPGEKPTCANCDKGKHTCIYPPVASRKRRHRDRDGSGIEVSPVVVRQHADIQGTQGAENINMWPSVNQDPTLFALHPTVGSSENGMGFWQSPGSVDWSNSQPVPNGQMYQPLDSGVMNGNGFESLDALLALDPAFPSVFHTDSSPPVATSNAPIRPDSQGSGPVARQKRIKFRVPYFRFFGPTAVAPGYKQVTSNVSRASSPISRDFLGLSGQPRFSPAPYDDYPHLDAVNHLVPVFQAHYGYYFSCIRIPRIDTCEGLRSITPSLLNIICALAARFSPLYGGTPPKQGMGNELNDESGWEQVSSIWATKAKEQAGHNLAVSTVELVETLLLISWYEFGGDRDAGLWMYSGMAMRMGQDLGLDALGRGVATDTPGADDHRRLHGCLRMIDAILTIGTGRPGIFQHPSWIVPTFPPLIRPNGSSLPDPFEHLIRIFVFVDAITNILIQDRPVNQKEALLDAQRELSEFYGNLPVELRFQASNLQAYGAVHQGEGFVLLHVWFHALIILSYCPDLLLGESCPIKRGDEASIEVAASSAKSISDIIAFAELIDAKSVCQPWINYPLYLAARTFLTKCVDVDDKTTSHTGAKAHIARAARQDFQRVMSMLRMVGKYWRGVRYVLRALEQKAEGIQQVDIADINGSLPPDLIALLERAAARPTSDAVGLSLVGTVNSPADNQYGLIFPLWGTPT